MKNLTVLTWIVFLTFQVSLIAQPSNFQTPVSINEDGATPDKNAMLDIQSADKGLLIPRMPYCDIEQIENPAEGLMIYDTEFHCLRIYIQGRWHCLYQKLDGPNADLNITGWANPTYDEDYNSSIAVDSEENVLVTMVTEDREIRLTKFDNKGNILWTIFENEGSKHGSVAIDDNDFIYTIASSDRERPINFNGASSNNFGDYITKTSPDGNNTQIFTFPGATIYDLALDENGNVLFSFKINDSIEFNGQTYNNTDGAIKVGVVKLTNNLQEVWIKLWDVFTDASYTSVYTSIDIDHEGNVGLVGRHYNGVSFTDIASNEIKTNNIYVTKLSALNGNHLWTKSIGSDFKFKNIDIQFFKLYTGGNFLVSFVETNSSVWPLDVSKGKLLHYSADGGFLNSSNILPGKVRDLYIDANNSRREVAVTFVEPVESTAFYLSPVKLLIFNYSNKFDAPKKIVDQSFNYPSGDLSFSQDGSKIFGIAVGTTAGNTIIEQEPGSENHIIYKVYNE